MLVSEDPAILRLDNECGIHAEDVMDFWRPNYREEALVDGKYSTRIYLRNAREAWRQYAEITGRSPVDRREPEPHDGTAAGVTSSRLSSISTTRASGTAESRSVVRRNVSLSLTSSTWQWPYPQASRWH